MRLSFLLVVSALAALLAACSGTRGSGPEAAAVTAAERGKSTPEMSSPAEYDEKPISYSDLNSEAAKLPLGLNL